jgi:cytochrome c oxidase cbb3-type subunit 3
MSDNHNASGGASTTGHAWDDDLADFTNPPPKWWMLGLTASAIWVVVYWTVYPAVPVAMEGTYFKGLGLPGLSFHLPGTNAKDDNKWTAIKELAIDQKELDAVRKPYEDKRNVQAKCCSAITARHVMVKTVWVRFRLANLRSVKRV